MPRTRAAEFEIEHLQVLDEEGEVDEQLAPDLSEDDLVGMYATMKRARRFDEKAVALQRRGESGTYAPSAGQEAAQVGSAFASRETDWIVPSFREGPAFLTRDTPMYRLLLYSMGMEEGAEVPEGANVMPPSIPVGSQAIHGAGLGWGHEIAGLDAATIVYFGDGATSEGDVYEAMNVAGVYDAHTVFFCQNNQYAISVPRARQTRAETLAQKAIGAGIEGIQVDGNDVLGVYAATRDALASAREGNPVMVEALTYRREMHTTADEPSVYRSGEEEDEWAERDPIDRFEEYLLDEGVLDEEWIADVEATVEDELDEQVERAREHRERLDPEEMFEYAYAELPPYVQRQRAAFREGRDVE